MIALCLLSLSACSTLTETQQRVLGYASRRSSRNGWNRLMRRRDQRRHWRRCRRRGTGYIIDQVQSSRKSNYFHVNCALMEFMSLL